MTTNGHGNGHLPLHELATLFPAMSDEEYAGLKADIAINGVHQPVAVWRQQLIDGRHRYQACQDLGIDPPLRYLPDDTDPLSFVLSANMSRRQLTASQKAIITAQLPKLRPQSNEQQREDSLSERPYSDSLEWRASLAGVGESTQEFADMIVDYGDSDVIAKIHSGNLSVHDAYFAVRNARNAQIAAEKARKVREDAEEKVRRFQEAEERARKGQEAWEKEERARRRLEESAEREAWEFAKAQRESKIVTDAKQRLGDHPDMDPPSCGERTASHSSVAGRKGDGRPKALQQ